MMYFCKLTRFFTQTQLVFSNGNFGIDLFGTHKQALTHKNLKIGENYKFVSLNAADKSLKKKGRPLDETNICFRSLPKVAQNHKYFSENENIYIYILGS